MITSPISHRRTRAHIEWLLPAVSYVLAIFGVICIAIATYNPDRGTDLSLLNHIINSSSASWQAIFVLVSVVVLFVVINIPLELFKSRAKLIYWGVLMLLIFTLLTATAISSVSAWLRVGWGRTIQPCEFAKLSILIMLARTLSMQEKPMGTFKDFMLVCVQFGAPAVVTLAQGETGTVIVMGFMFLVMILFSGVDIRLWWAMMAMVVLLVAAFFGYALFSGSTDYRITRILSFLDPQKYYNSAGYQILNSQMSIGSGRMNGIGMFVVGSISQLDYVPEDHTDFIFSAIGEAFGFVGCCILLGLYLIMILRMIYLARFTEDRFGQLLIIGVMAMLFLHIFENIAMNVGIMPITGIPLPFVSYGGSNFMTNIVGIALVVNVVKSRSSTTQIMFQTKQRTKRRKRRKLLPIGAGS